MHAFALSLIRHLLSNTLIISSIHPSIYPYINVPPSYETNFIGIVVHFLSSYLVYVSAVHLAFGEWGAHHEQPFFIEGRHSSFITCFASRPFAVVSHIDISYSANLFSSRSQFQHIHSFIHSYNGSSSWGRRGMHARNRTFHFSPH